MERTEVLVSVEEMERQRVRESHDGIEGSTDLMGHVRQEDTLQSSGLNRTLCLLFQ